MTERKNMPLVHLDAPFPIFEDLVPHLEDLTRRVRAYVAQEPTSIFDHPYREMTLAVWLESVPNGLIAQMLVSQRPFVKNECPPSALLFDLSEILGKKDVRLRDVHTYLQSESWLQLLMTEHNIRWLKEHAVA